MPDDTQDFKLSSDDPSHDLHPPTGDIKMTEKSVQELERELVLDPDAQIIRKQLMEFYGTQNTPSAALAALPHIHWMIDNCPGEYFTITLPFTEEQRFEIKQHCLQSIELHQDDQNMIGDVGLTLSCWKDPLAEELLRKAHQVNPKELRWAWELASYYRAQSLTAIPELRPEYARLGVFQTERCLGLKIARGDKIGLITELTPLAIEFRYFSQARKWSRSLLLIGNSDMKWLALIALLFLARIEILDGNYQQGKAFLDDALEVFRSTDLSYFAGGLEMMRLLKLLLSQGKETVVSETLEICLTKCDQPDQAEKVRAWLSQLQNGEHPQFETEYLAMETR